jgi:hypothetical protein
MEEQNLINENVNPQIYQQAEENQDFPPPIPIYDPIVGGIWPLESANADLANYSLYDDNEDNV